MLSSSDIPHDMAKPLITIIGNYCFWLANILEIQKDRSTITKFIARKPLYLQTDINENRPTT